MKKLNHFHYKIAKILNFIFAISLIFDICFRLFSKNDLILPGNTLSVAIMLYVLLSFFVASAHTFLYESEKKIVELERSQKIMPDVLERVYLNSSIPAITFFILGVLVIGMPYLVLI